MSEKKSFVKFLIVGFPLGLMILGGVSLFLYEERRVDQTEETPMTRRATEKGMISHFNKLNEFMSPRSFKNDAEVTHLLRTTAFIEGSLSPMNTGMVVRSEKALTKIGRIWKKYEIVFDGVRKKAPERISVNYVNASDAEIALAVSLGEALPNVKLERNLVLEFSPLGQSNAFTEWLEEAKVSAKDNVLMVGGYDWELLVEKVEAFINEREAE